MNINSQRALFLVLAVTTITTFGPLEARAIDYGKDIAPLWKKNCVACHNSKKAEGGLNLESATLLLKGSDSGQSVIAGKSGESELLKRIIATDDTAMPPRDNSAGAKPLTAAEVELVKQWIDAGAMPGEESMATTIAWQPVPGAFQPIYAADASIDGQFVASGRGNQVVVHSWPLLNSSASAIALVDPATVNTAGVASAHLDLVQSIAFSPDAQTLASGGFRCVKLWKRDYAPTALVGLKPSTGVVAASHSGALLAIAREDKSIELIDMLSRQTRVKLPAAASAIAEMVFSVDDLSLLVRDTAGAITAWILPPSGSTDVAPKALPITPPAAVTAMAPLTQDRVALLLADGQVAMFVAESAATNENKGAMSFAKKDFTEPVTGAVAIAACAGSPLRLIVALGDGNLRAIDATEAKPLTTWKSPVAVTKIAAHPQGGRVASLGADGTLRLWNVVDGKEISSVTPETAQARLVAAAQRAVARTNAEVERLAASVKELEAAHKKEEEAMKKVSEERDKALAAATTKKTDVENNTKAIQEAEKGIETAKAMIAEQMKRIETLTADIEAKKKKEPELVAAHKTAMEAVTKQDQALAASKDGVERAAKAIPAQQAVVDSTKTVLTSLQSEQTALAEKAKATREEVPVAFGFDQSGQELVLASKRGAITVVDVAAGRVAMELKSAANLVSVVGTGRMLLAAHNKSPLSAWSIEPSWKLDRVIGSETEPNSPLSDRITALAFSPDGATLAIGSGPASRFGDVKLYNVSTGSLVKDLGEVHSDTVLDMAFSPDGKQLASCGADKLVRVFDLSTGKQRLGLEGHTHHVLSIAWQSNGRVLVSGSADGTVKIWDTITGEQQRTVSGFGKEITSISYVGTSTQFLAACADNSLKLIEGNDGKTVRAFAGSASALYAVCTSPDDKQAIAGGQDGKLIIWTIADAKVLKNLE